MLRMWHMRLMLSNSVHIFKTFNKPIVDSKNQHSSVLAALGTIHTV